MRLQRKLHFFESYEQIHLQRSGVNSQETNFFGWEHQRKALPGLEQVEGSQVRVCSSFDIDFCSVFSCFILSFYWDCDVWLCAFDANQDKFKFR